MGSGPSVVGQRVWGDFRRKLLCHRLKPRFLGKLAYGFFQVVVSGEDKGPGATVGKPHIRVQPFRACYPVIRMSVGTFGAGWGDREEHTRSKSEKKFVIT